jgi:branched-chain amino acid transport system ATP-binding protein
MDDIILETIDLRKEFDALVAVDDVSIKVKQHSLHAIIGPNGAGKTTFFNLLSGNLDPTRGSVFFKGRNITNQFIGPFIQGLGALSRSPIFFQI